MPPESATDARDAAAPTDIDPHAIGAGRPRRDPNRQGVPMTFADLVALTVPVLLFAALSRLRTDD